MKKTNPIHVILFVGFAGRKGLCSQFHISLKREKQRENEKKAGITYFSECGEEARRVKEEQLIESGYGGGTHALTPKERS